MLVAALCFACSEPLPEVPEPSRAVHHTPVCDPGPLRSFFPDGTFEADRFDLRQSGATILNAMGERSLSCGTVPESYRFLWNHSFSGMPEWAPVAARLTRTAKGWTAVAVRLDDARHLRVAERREVALTAEAASHAVDAIGQFGLWQREPFAMSEAFDGDTWIVEGRRGTAYYVVARVNQDERALRTLALAFLKAAGMSPGHIAF